MCSLPHTHRPGEGEREAEEGSSCTHPTFSLPKLCAGDFQRERRGGGRGSRARERDKGRNRDREREREGVREWET